MPDIKYPVCLVTLGFALLFFAVSALAKQPGSKGRPIVDVAGDIRTCEVINAGPNCTPLFKVSEPPRLLEAFFLSVRNSSDEGACSADLVVELDRPGGPTVPLYKMKAEPNSSRDVFVTLPRPILINFGSNTPGDTTNVGILFSVPADCRISLGAFTRLAK